MKVRDIDIKNSPFLKQHMKEQRDKIVKQLKQHDKYRMRPILCLALAFIAFLVMLVLDPLAVRFIFHGY